MLFNIIGLTLFLLFVIPINIKNDLYGVIKGDMANQVIEPNQHYLKINHLLKNPKKYNSYFFGSSRVGKIDTRNIHDCNSWYNLSYSEAIPYENLTDLKLLLQNGVVIKNIVIGLDNISYLVAPEIHLNQALRKPYQSYRSIFYYLTLKPSLTFIKENIKKTVHYDIANSGFPIVLYKDKWIDSNKSAHINDPKFCSPSWSNYYSDRIKNSIREITEIIEICSNNNINLKLFINPMHSTTYLKLNEKRYFNFLTLLAGQKAFYDFSGINKITSNNFNYYETSHYRPFIGELIKSIILEQKKSDFVHIITKENIDSILKLKKSELNKARTHNKELN